MSDGPHRCLSLRKLWKDAAHAADRDTFSDEAVDERVSAAMSADWTAEVPAQLLRDIAQCFSPEGQISLLPPTGDDIGRLRDHAGGSVLGELLISHAEDAAARGLGGDTAVVAIVAGTLEERGERCLRHIQEIYQRESNDGRARRVIARVGPAVGNAVTRLTGALVATTRPPKRTPIQRATGIDDGVPLQ